MVEHERSDQMAPRRSTLGAGFRETFSRQWTETAQFGRGITERLGLDYTAEDTWSRKLVDDYQEVAATDGVEGDVPSTIRALHMSNCCFTFVCE